MGDHTCNNSNNIGIGGVYFSFRTLVLPGSAGARIFVSSFGEFFFQDQGLCIRSPSEALLRSGSSLHLSPGRHERKGWIQQHHHGPMGTGTNTRGRRSRRGEGSKKRFDFDSFFSLLSHRIFRPLESAAGRTVSGTFSFSVRGIALSIWGIFIIACLLASADVSLAALAAIGAHFLSAVVIRYPCWHFYLPFCLAMGGQSLGKHF